MVVAAAETTAAVLDAWPCVAPSAAWAICAPAAASAFVSPSEAFSTMLVSAIASSSSGVGPGLMRATMSESNFSESSLRSWSVGLWHSATAFPARMSNSSANFKAFLRMSAIASRALWRLPAICSCFARSRELRSAMTYHTRRPATRPIAAMVIPITPSTLPATPPSSCSGGGAE